MTDRQKNMKNAIKNGVKEAFEIAAETDTEQIKKALQRINEAIYAGNLKQIATTATLEVLLEQ